MNWMQMVTAPVGGAYDYASYKSILTIDAAADNKEFINASKGIYYNGVPLIKQKANFIKTSAYKGVYGWYSGC